MTDEQQRATTEVASQTPEHSISPDVPQPKTPLSVNEAEVKRWITSEPDPQFQEIKQKLVDNLALVPHEVFLSALKRCISTLNEKIQGSDYVVLWDSKPHSSKRWVYEQAQPELTTQPVQETYFGVYDAMEDFESFREILDKGIDTFVVMDDAIYSGEQFRNATLKKLIEVYKKFGYYPSRFPKILLVAPYSTRTFQTNEVTQAAQEQGILTLLTEQTMPTLNDVLSPAERQAIQERGGTLDLPEDAKERGMLDPNDNQVFFGATLTAFDHRVADAHSFCEPLAYRLGVQTDKPYADSTTSYFDKEEQEYKAYQTKRLQKAEEIRAQKTT
ncbi:hypothetical protein H3C66_01695 [Patescibacteria group bacterium]|nr:hypothetical protein [Patescibacteria group bacterium]